MSEAESLLFHRKEPTKTSWVLYSVIIVQFFVIFVLILLIQFLLRESAELNPLLNANSVEMTLGGPENNRPIIGILTQPIDDLFPDGTHPAWADAYLQQSYVQWLDAGGARVAVIPYDAPFDKLQSLFQGINGLVIPGGDQPLFFNTTFVSALQYLFNLAMEANEDGDYFPVWGTCMGMQALAMLTAQDPSVLERNYYDSENMSLPLAFTPSIRDSLLFGLESTPRQILEIFSNEPVTANFHHDGVTPSTFLSTQALHRTYRILAVNVDRQNKPFVSAYESKRFPIFGVQFHPETNQFGWGRDAVQHSLHAVQAAQYLTEFLVNQARRNFHFFPTPKEEEEALVYHYQSTYTGSEMSDARQTYFFKAYKDI